MPDQSKGGCMTAKEAIYLLNCGQPGSPMRISALRELKEAAEAIDKTPNQLIKIGLFG